MTLLLGSCLDELRNMPDNSVDSIVTDPPYGLSNTGPDHVRETLSEWLLGNREYLPSTSGGFMGKAWDSFVPPVAVWDECLRVLKPGGYLLTFAGSRTMDLMSLGVRLAGFDIRDSIAWLYGSGFPKSMDVSKAIDKARKEDLEPTRAVCRAVRAAMDAQGLKSRDLVEHFDGCHPRLIDHWAARDTDSQPALPKWDQWETLRDILGLGGEMDAEVWRLNGRKGTPGEAWESREVTGEVEQWTDRTNYAMTSRDGLRRDTPATDAARQWEGWGTALKPAFEPVIMARKPFKGTVAANVLEHGTGALNIDASRIESGEEYHGLKVTQGGDHFSVGSEAKTRGSTFQPSSGRFPANVILDESQAAALDAQSGTLKSGKGNVRRASGSDRGGNTSATYGAESRPAGSEMVSYGDSGGASRFFYVAKAPKSERPVVDGLAHPTVKPLALMRYLVKLVTPPGGTVLDPFAGSGSTAEAALLEWFSCIAIEREPDYHPLIQTRLDRVFAAQIEELI